ncbi:MAG: helix-turn-helix transcriptional regulator [Thermodesulfobacteriota bacterium]
MRKSSAFPAKLRAAREARGLSQAELAEKTGLQPSAVSHFETERRSPSFDNLKRLADALTVSTDYLLGRVDEMTGTGPRAEQIFRHIGEMSESDQAALEEMAAILAKKSKERKAKE